MSWPESRRTSEEALRMLVEDVDSDAKDFQELNIAITDGDEAISSDVEAVVPKQGGYGGDMGDISPQ